VIPQPAGDDRAVPVEQVASGRLLEDGPVPPEHVVHGVSVLFPLCADQLADGPVVRLDDDGCHPGHAEHLGEAEHRPRQVVQSVLHQNDVVAVVSQLRHVLGVQEQGLEPGIEPPTALQSLLGDVGDRDVLESEVSQERALAPHTATHQEHSLVRRIQLSPVAENVEGYAQTPVPQIACQGVARVVKCPLELRPIRVLGIRQLTLGIHSVHPGFTHDGRLSDPGGQM
jgi:hypothetical protein